MLKKIFSVFITLLTLLPLNAQQTVGEWYVYPLFSETISEMYDTGNIVYYKSGTRLFSYDKSANETYCYTTSNKLNDTNVSGIYYNYEKGYLAVTYDTGNIDLIYDNGRVVNLPDIKNANLTTSKTINDVDFGNGRIAVATSFGIVIFNDTRHEVEQSSILNVNIPVVTMLGDFVVFNYNTGVYYGNATKHLNNLDKYTLVPNMAVNLSRLVSGAGDLIIGQGADGAKKIMSIHLDTTNALINITELSGVPNSTIKRYQSGFYASNDNTIFTIDAAGTKVTTKSLATAQQKNMVAMYNGLSSVWLGDLSGIANYDLSGSTATLIKSKFKPNAIVNSEAVFFAVSADGQKIYITSPAFSRRGSVGESNASYATIKQRTTVLDNGEPHDATLTTSSNTKGSAFNYFKRTTGWSGIIGGSQDIAVDPNNSNRQFVTNALEGVFVVENNQQVGLFNTANSPMKVGDSTGTMFAEFDPQGNLWVGLWKSWNSATPSLIMLPSAKVQGDLSAVTASDWFDTKITSMYDGDKSMHIMFCKKSNMAFLWDELNGSLYAIDTKGTYGDPTDDVILQHTSYTDQDGKTFKPMYIYTVVEDAKGRVWVGTNTGVFEITSPATATSPTMTINHIKVPRNDGTNYADYLLDSEPVFCISVDGQNRKWIGTDGSGLYLVSENGDKIIDQFDMDNSPLTTNTIQNVLCDPLSNRVYIGLATGLMHYNSTSSPASDDYTNVYAYPNPVRPDYTGWITITGLMEDSLVKIADTAGNVFHQGRSEGGMFVWDGCNAAGDRVKSGVYFVYASQGSDSSTSAVVTKILVVN
jgi:hypothetical protein